MLPTDGTVFWVYGGFGCLIFVCKLSLNVEEIAVSMLNLMCV